MHIWARYLELEKGELGVIGGALDQVDASVHAAEEAAVGDEIAEANVLEDCSTDGDIQTCSGGIIDRNYDDTLDKYNFKLVRFDVPTTSWAVVRKDTNDEVARISQVWGHSYKATCKLKHRPFGSNGSRRQCAMILSARNDIGTMFLDLLDWIGNGIAGDEGTAAHSTSASEYVAKYARSHC